VKSSQMWYGKWRRCRTTFESGTAVAVSSMPWTCRQAAVSVVKRVSWCWQNKPKESGRQSLSLLHKYKDQLSLTSPSGMLQHAKSSCFSLDVPVLLEALTAFKQQQWLTYTQISSMRVHFLATFTHKFSELPQFPQFVTIQSGSFDCCVICKMQKS